ncbi:MAG: M48 family metalloprotease [Ferruginibacter sp.]
MDQSLYPSSPLQFDPKKLEPGVAFRKQVSTVIISILLFLIVYLLLVALSIVLVLGCFYAGVAIIVAKPAFFTIMIGLGLMGLGIAVFVFLVKFVFSVSKNENALRIEVTGVDQPGLFSFIRNLTTETNTPFPKKIFISGDVNAAVFYNSSFWSMFLPVRKNLEIGLGFVNSVNISEFKAVMAHEFGHFSQRSMKLGSFTYNVNKIIYNMLYDNNSYTNFLDSWGKVSGYFAFFAAATVHIARAIQSVLKGMYTFINKNYMGLSREMEFHADAVAASVAGANNLISALSKIELAGECYNTALSNAGEWLKEKKVSTNLFSYQLSVFQRLARDNNLGINEGIPEVPFHFIQSFSRSRVNFKNQWASHPTLEERKNHLEKLDITADPVNTSAWTVFENASGLQQQMTKMLYGESIMQENLEVKDELFFEDWFKNERESNKLPEAYKGFYDNRFFNTAGWNIEAIAKMPVSTNMEELFTDECRLIQKALTSNELDLTTIQNIKEKHIDIKSFDFDGEKFLSSDCDQVIIQLEKEIASLRNRQHEIEKEALSFFHQVDETDSTLILEYRKYQSFELVYENYTTVVNKLLQILKPFYSEKCDIRYIISTIERMKENEEQKIKNFFSRFIEENYIGPGTKGKLLDRVTAFRNRSYAYFSNEQFHNEELTELTDLTFAVADELNNFKWKFYKNLLEIQLERYHSMTAISA